MLTGTHMDPQLHPDDPAWDDVGRAGLLGDLKTVIAALQQPGDEVAAAHKASLCPDPSNAWPRTALAEAGAEVPGVGGRGAARQHASRQRPGAQAGRVRSCPVVAST